LAATLLATLAGLRVLLLLLAGLLLLATLAALLLLAALLIGILVLLIHCVLSILLNWGDASQRFCPEKR
jgi:hypothetical protein